MATPSKFGIVKTFPLMLAISTSLNSIFLKTFPTILPVDFTERNYPIFLGCVIFPISPNPPVSSSFWSPLRLVKQVVPLNAQ